ncbi:MAG TPA: LLM class F420-dependent oxidoreductase [Candidatus Binatia bacterium]|nr:LLM class F420-dependent oxidoreductase [Candidatus Binatia bacterium]
MRLGLLLGFWDEMGPPSNLVEAVREAEALGYESVWTSEASGSDALTPLAWLGAHSRAMRLGTCIMQMAARPPSAAAMAALSLDHLSKGRFVLGLGLSGPQLVEGWYGQPFDPPLGRTREYLEIVRRVLARRAPVEFQGEHFRLPLAGGSGLGRPFLASVRPLRPDLPILLAAEGPRNVALAREIADGWIAAYYSPHRDRHLRAALAEGEARPGARRAAADFEIVATPSLVVDDDVEAAAGRLRPLFARFIGGMGAPGRNFHFNALARLGFEGAVTTVRDLWLEGRHRDAEAAVPRSLIEEVSLIGPPAKIREELAEWRRSPVSTLLIHVPLDARALRQAAEIVLAA